MFLDVSTQPSVALVSGRLEDFHDLVQGLAPAEVCHSVTDQVTDDLMAVVVSRVETGMGHERDDVFAVRWALQ